MSRKGSMDMHAQLHTSWDVLLLVVFLRLLYIVVRKTLPSRSSRRATPPGPSGLPIVGSAYQIPLSRQWLKFDEWIKEHGEIVYVTVMGQPTIILGSIKASLDLLENRGTIYSDRPGAVMAGELVGWNRGLGYSPGPHSPRFREFRRLFHQFMGPRPVQRPEILAAQEANTSQLLLRLLQEPEDFLNHVRQSTGALILRLTFGYSVVEDQNGDPLVNIVEKAMQGFARASEPGAFLVDTIPILKYVPYWFPGAGFQREAMRMRHDLEELYDVPYNFVKQQMVALSSCIDALGSVFDPEPFRLQTIGDAEPSFVSAFLEEKLSPTAAEEELIKAAAASLYSGGADTTPSSLASFILAMTLYPDIQVRAQAEIDSVLGSSWHRLPCFADRPNLPYVEAIMLELLRWNPAVPLGLAHQLTQDDVYKGYHLKKGTVVWANIWTMLHDEKVFADPHNFIPERYLNEHGALRNLGKAEDPLLGFGFGRRICPGMYFANNSIFIAVAMMLYVFQISKALGEDGCEVTPDVEYDGFISHPRPFKCTIKSRSAAAEALIKASSRGNSRS